MVYTIDGTKSAYNRKEPIEFLFFYGHSARGNTIVGNECLSQFYEAGFIYKECSYHTMEQFIMAKKAETFSDYASYLAIMDSKTPNEAKKLGRKVRNYDDEVWAGQRGDLAVIGNLEKFRQNRNLGAYLLSTGNKILVEASPYDQIWGIGLDKANPCCKSPNTWNGDNLLGFVLMEVRDILREGSLC